jgi:hypothetical protein
VEIRRTKLAVLSRANRPVPPETARTTVRTESTSVSHPSLPCLTERVHPVLDRGEVLQRQKKFGNEPVAAKPFFAPGRC